MALEELRKHPKYYLTGCPYPTIQAGDTLFKFHWPSLQIHSKFLESMGDLPQLLDNGAPMKLQNITADTFEAILDWLIGEWQPKQLPLRIHIEMLRVSSYLMIRSLGRYALHEVMNYHPPLDAHKKLELSQELPILNRQWVWPAVGVLVTISDEQFLESRASMIGLHPSIILKIVGARMILSNRRAVLAYSQPSADMLPGIDCDVARHRSCYQAWVTQWWDHVARRLLHPDNQKRLEISKTPDFLRSLSWDSIPRSCVDSFIDGLESINAFGVEMSIIDAATDSVLEYLRELHGSRLEEFDFEEDEARDEARARNLSL